MNLRMIYALMRMMYENPVQDWHAWTLKKYSNEKLLTLRRLFPAPLSCIGFLMDMSHEKLKKTEENMLPLDLIFESGMSFFEFFAKPTRKRLLYQFWIYTRTSPLVMMGFYTRLLSLFNHVPLYGNIMEHNIWPVYLINSFEAFWADTLPFENTMGEWAKIYQHPLTHSE